MSSRSGTAASGAAEPRESILLQTSLPSSLSSPSPPIYLLLFTHFLLVHAFIGSNIFHLRFPCPISSLFCEIEDRRFSPSYRHLTARATASWFWVLFGPRTKKYFPFSFFILSFLLCVRLSADFKLLDWFVGSKKNILAISHKLPLSEIKSLLALVYSLK